MQIEYADVSSEIYYNKWTGYENLSFVCSYCLFLSFQEFLRYNNIFHKTAKHLFFIFRSLYYNIYLTSLLYMRPASMQLKWFKSRPLRPTFNYKYVLHPFSHVYMQHMGLWDQLLINKYVLRLNWCTHPLPFFNLSLPV